MSNKKSTKRALLMSVISLLLCCSMLVGTTYAWFTDEVTSGSNIITSGTLDAELYYGDSADAVTNDASTGKIFDYQYWEPGYTQVKYVKIVNNGNLAFQFQLNIIPEELPAAGEYNLADVIDVYVFDPSVEVTREAVKAATPVGTLSSLIADRDGAAYGYLLPAENVGSNDYNTEVTAPRGEITYCIVLKMQESAGNEYQNLSVGNGFSVQLLATQYTWENDSFDHLYDQMADFAPKADVKETGAKLIDTSTHGTILANTTFQFQPTESLAEAQQSPYRYYHADYVVSFDKTVPENTLILPGYYHAYCDDYNNGLWFGLSNDDIEIPANEEIRLIEVLSEAMGWNITVNYESICEFGNDGTGFLCGVSDQSNGKLAGTTMTVELRLYETTGDPTTTTGPKNEETGEYMTIGTYTYTFGEETVVGNAEQLQAALNDGVTNIELIEGTYTTNFSVPSGKEIVISGAGENTILQGQIATTSSTEGKLTLKNLTINVDDNIVDSTGISQTSKSAIAIWGNQTVICENVTFNMSLADSTAITSWWDTGIGTTIIVRDCTFNCNGQRPIRATGNVTVEDCTFNDPYRYAVQLTAKASTATELDKAVINFKNNTIVNGENGKAYVYGVQLEGADYGCHDCVINGTGNIIVNGGTESTVYYCECGKVDHNTVTFNTEVAPVHEG